MPSTYTPPDVYVQQVRKSNANILRQPQLPVVIVGQARQIVTRETAGSYAAGTQVVVPFPGLTPGGVVHEDSIEIILDARVATGGGSGKPLGLFKLNSTEYTILRDASNNPSGLSISSDIVLEVSLLSDRNNDFNPTNNDYATATSMGYAIVDKNIDFLSRGVSDRGDTFVIVSSPASMAGRYVVRRCISTNNKIYTLVVEKVDGDGDPIVNKTFAATASAVAEKTTLVGAPLSHEFVSQNNVQSAHVGEGIGVESLIPVDASGQVKIIEGANLSTLLANARLRIPGKDSSIPVVFAPVNASNAPVNRDNDTWRRAVERAAPGDWVRIQTKSLTGSSSVSISSISYSGPAAGRITFAPADFSTLQPHLSTNRSLVITGNGSSANNTAYAILSVDSSNNAVVVDLSPWNGQFPGGSSATLGSAAVAPLPAEIRDFKIVSVNKAQYEFTISAEGAAPVSYLVMDTSTLQSIKFLKVLQGSARGESAAGDFVVFDLNGVPQYYEVLDATPTRLSFARPLPASFGANVATVTFAVFRGLPYRGTVFYDVVRQLESGWVADVEVSYIADRRDLPLEGPVEISGRRDIQDLIGVIHPKNPLALGCDMVVRSGLTDGTRSFYALATNGEGIDAHLEAMEKLETLDVYFVVPLTQDESIISAYRAHVTSQSQPKNKHERVVIASTKILDVETVYPRAGEPLPTGRAATAQTFQANIEWGSVKIGDVIKIIAEAGTSHEYVELSNRITAINTATKSATVLTPWPSSIIGIDRVFRIDTYPPTKLEQAEAWRDQAKSFGLGEGGNRVMLIRPDKIEITYTDTTVVPTIDRTIVVGAEYACCAFAGLSAALPVDAPLTNVPIPGIRRLIHSNEYFRPDHLNVIAEGGNNILVQDTRNSMPYSRHQMMCDTTSLITREFSIVKIVDFSAKFIRNSLRPYIGNRNITQQYLTQLRGTCEAVIRALVRSNILLHRTELLSLKQDQDVPDQILIEIALDVPYPANRIYVTLYI